MKKLFYTSIFFVFAFFSCTKNEIITSEETSPSDDGTGQIVFSFKQKNENITGESYAADEELRQGVTQSANGTAFSDTIKFLKYCIVKQGTKEIINPQWSKLEPDFSSLCIQGIEGGDYSLLVYATTCDDSKLSDIAIEGNNFILKNKNGSSPLDEDWLYGKVDFYVAKKVGLDSIYVNLSRCVGRLNVNISPVNNIYTLSQINEVLFSVEDADGIYSDYSFYNENFEGNSGIKDYDISKNRGFYCFPTSKPVKGIVTVRSTQESGKKVESKYDFEGLNIQSGKVTSLNVNWESGEGDRGFFRVRESDYVDSTYMEMFADDEPRDVMYSRFFVTNKPLQFKINEDKKLQINFFSPIDIKDIDLYVRFKKYSAEFFKLAKIDVVKGFCEVKLPMPVVYRDCMFETRDGRHVTIPRQENLSNEDCDFIYKTDDPFMKKIDSITCPIRIGFFSTLADYTWAGFRHMTPYLCRHGCVFGIDLSFLFSTKEFADKVNGWPGTCTTSKDTKPLMNGDGSLIDPSVTIARARGIRSLNIGLSSGDGGKVGGGYYCLEQEAIPSMTINKYRDKVLCQPGEVIFHELGHVMGYGHNSNMTYGNSWTTLGQELLYEMNITHRLPVNYYIDSQWSM